MAQQEPPREQAHQARQLGQGATRSAAAARAHHSLPRPVRGTLVGGPRLNEGAVSREGTRMADVQVRAARAADKGAVLAFCERGSPEGDYVAVTWDAWLEDADGALLVAEEAGQPVGVAHLRMVAEREGWLEGLRVDPERQRHGTGGRLVAAVLEAARGRRAEAVRLFTSSDNASAQHVFERAGFQQVAVFVFYEAEAVEGAIAAALEGGATLRAAHAADRDALWAFLRASNLVPLNGGLLLEKWHARALTPHVLLERLEADAVRVLEAWGTVQGMAVLERRQETRHGPTLRVQYLDGTAEGIGRLALALREEAARASLDRVVVRIPDLLILHDAMDGAGYTRWTPWAETILCYARRLGAP
jgi:ribosomal protein S18 acetylase RimI-like enzyme